MAIISISWINKLRLRKDEWLSQNDRKNRAKQQNIIKRKESNQKTKGKRSREEKNRTKSTKKQIQWQ